MDAQRISNHRQRKYTWMYVYIAVSAQFPAADSNANILTPITDARQVQAKIGVLFISMSILQTTSNWEYIFDEIWFCIFHVDKPAKKIIEDKIPFNIYAGLECG